MLQLWDAVCQGEQLVDLLLVLGENELRLAIIEEIRSFFVEHVAVEPEAQASNRMSGDFRRDPVRPVVADDADDILASKAQFDKAEREVAHPCLVVVPGERAP
ncbi:hypothetical protein ACVWZK_004195 [Bradyrhizobium sp. GM0.4]